MISLVCTYLSPLSMLKIDQDLVLADPLLDTSFIWKKFCKRWDVENEHGGSSASRRKKKREGMWKNKYWERALRTCFNEINLVRSRWIISPPDASSFPSSNTTTNPTTNPANVTLPTNSALASDPKDPLANCINYSNLADITNSTNDSHSTNSTNPSNSTNPDSEDPRNSAKWVLGSNCVTAMLRPILPRGVTFSSSQRSAKIWMFEEFVDMCAEFINEVRLFNIIISMHNMPKLKNLRSLTMSYARSQGIWVSIVEILKSATQIKELIFEYVFLDDLSLIWETLIQLGTPLTSIFLNTGNLTGCKQFSQLISTLQLRELTMWDVNFETDSESEFFKSLVANPALEHLDIEEINLSGGLGVIPHLAELISLPESRLTYLDLTECMLESFDITAVCEALQRNSRIKTLNFSSNFMETAGATAIAKLFSSNSTITDMSISDCKLAHDGLEKFITGLSSSKVASTLINLDLSYNFGGNLGECWAKLLSSCTILKKLNLESTQLGISGLSEDFLDSLRNHPTLTNLNLSANRLGDVGTLKLLPTLAANTSLQIINLSGNLISHDGGNAIATAFLNREIRSLDVRRNLLGAAAQRIRQLPGIAKLLIGYADERVIIDGVQEV